MKEIKFRVFDGKQFQYINIEKGGWFKAVKNLIEVVEKENPLQQYIGLKDKTEREIYEGDIINTVQRGIEVIEMDCEYDMIGYHACWEKGIIIGNIYENPELLK